MTTMQIAVALKGTRYKSTRRSRVSKHVIQCIFVFTNSAPSYDSLRQTIYHPIPELLEITGTNCTTNDEGLHLRKDCNFFDLRCIAHVNLNRRTHAGSINVAIVCVAHLEGYIRVNCLGLCESSCNLRRFTALPLQRLSRPGRIMRRVIFVENSSTLVALSFIIFMVLPTVSVW